MKPIFYVCSTPWNLLGLRHWLPELHFLTAADFCEGDVPRLVHPPSLIPTDDDTFESLNDRILADPGVLETIRAQGGSALFLMFDEGNAARLGAAGLSLALPDAALRAGLDDKIAATRLGDEAGVRSVPNVLGRVDGYPTLRRLAAALGPDLVIQLPFGDSGRTTFFVSSEADYARHAAEIEATPEVKVMRRIRCRPAAIEACVTRDGIVVGPLVTELVGFPELTPYRGGWCGNELAPDAFSDAILDEAAALTRRLGERMAARGYRGVYGLDFLIDADAGDLYLGELNPRITGVTPISTQAARDRGCPPLVLIHLHEWLDLPGRIDLADVNARFRRPDKPWSQLIIKEIREDVPPVDRTPRGGIWRMDASSTATHARPGFDTGDLADDEALVARTVGPGFSRSRGTPIARVLAPGRMMAADWTLTPRAKAWIDSVRATYL
jgi:hypothetical protein